MEFIISKEQYIAAKAAWNNIANRSPSDHILYNVLRGFDAQRGFTEITNPTKLANGASPWGSFNRAKHDARWNLREPVATSARSVSSFNARLKYLSDTWGFEFTSEFAATLREILK